MKINIAIIIARLSLLCAGVLWGGGFLAAHFSLQVGIQPFFMMSLRFSIASFVLLCFGWKPLKKHFKKNWKGGFLLGFFLFLGFATQTIGLVYTSPANNAFLTSVNVVMTPFVVMLFFHKKLSKKVYIASLFSFVGIYFLIGPHEIESFSKGDILSLICAFFFACHIVFVGYYTPKKELNVRTLITLQMVTVMILSWLAAFIAREVDFNLLRSVSGLSNVLYLGIFSTLIAFTLQNYGQRILGQTEAAILLATESLFATLFAIYFTDETWRWQLLFGGSFIFMSVLIVEAKLSFSRK